MISSKLYTQVTLYTHMVILKNIDVCTYIHIYICALNNNEKQSLKFEKEQ